MKHPISSQEQKFPYCAACGFKGLCARCTFVDSRIDPESSQEKKCTCKIHNINHSYCISARFNTCVGCNLSPLVSEHKCYCYRSNAKVCPCRKCGGYAECMQNSCPHCSISKEGESLRILKQALPEYNVTFMENNKKIGVLSWESGEMKFEGNANKSAELFIKGLNYYFKEFISKQIQLSLQEEREAKTQLIKKLYKDVRVLNFRGVRTESLTDEAYNEAIDDVLSILLEK